MIFTHTSLALTFAALTVFLSGCSDEKDTKDATPNTPRLISSLTFESATLKKCVDDKARSSGIEYVSDLKKLTCQSPWTDVRAITFEYETLAEMDSETLSSITSTIGISQLTALEELSFHRQWISKIDLTKLTNLKHLVLDDIIIQELDLSQNKELKSLSVHCSPLSKLTLPSSSKLESLDMAGYGDCETLNFLPFTHEEEFDLGLQLYDEVKHKETGLSLTHIDYESFPIEGFSLKDQNQLKNITLTYYRLDLDNSINSLLESIPKGNQVESLNLKNTRPKNLSLSSFTGLLELNIRSNELEEIDVSSNTELVRLDVSHNNLTNIIFPSDDSKLVELDTSFNSNLTPFVGYFPKLQKATLSGDVNAENLEMLMPSLLDFKLSEGRLLNGSINHNSLTSVIIGDTLINDVFEPNLPNATKLEVYRNQLTEVHLANVPKLESLAIWGNDLKELNLSLNTTLETLSLNDVPITEDNLQLPNSLKDIFFRRLRLSSFNTEELGLTNLRVLELENTPIDVIEVHKTFDNFENLTLNNLRLKTLDLTPFSKMTGHLIIKNCPITTISATGLSHVSFSIISDLALDSESQSLLESLL